ncbi:phosphotransferase [Paractinoplanes atraurantiacus]|nr:phosphotransferase [Actinoplanes atraurantiacus]
MRESGLADLLASLPELVYVGLSAGSVVMTRPAAGAGDDTRLGLVDFSLSVHLDDEAGAEAWAAGIAGPAYAIDAETAIKVVDGAVEVVSEGRWRLFNDEDLVRDLLRDQHPDLADLPIREVAGGWGNQMWRLGDDLAVRIQRMDTSADLQLRERRWLPLLAPRLPLPIPVPVRSGVPSERFPKMWTVVSWVEGTPLDRGSIDRGDHGADTLAAFLRALHVEAPADAPDGGDFGAHPRDCTGGFERFLGAIEDLGEHEDHIRTVWDDAVAAPGWPGPRVWVHGDLHPANVVVADGTLAGVVDFGALFAGDPAWDLGAAWLLLPEGYASRFFDRYAGADEATVRRARGLAAMKCLFLMLMGQNGDRGLPGGKPNWGPAGRAALRRVLKGL